MIMRNSHDYRPLGLGYANLGALLMATGLPYDSDAGRDYAGCVTAIMCGQAYLQSSRIAELGPPLLPATEECTKAYESIISEENAAAAPGDSPTLATPWPGPSPACHTNPDPFLHFF